MSELRIVSAQEWRQRAETAETALANLRGEAILLREALAWALENGGWRLIYYSAHPVPAAITHTGGAGSDARINDDLVPKSAALGALVAASLEETRLERVIAAGPAKAGMSTAEIAELIKAIHRVKGMRRAAADAVLAAMGKEGA